MSAVAWLWLIAAGGLEVGFTTFMKLSSGFTRLWPSVAFAACATASFGCLAMAARAIPLGIAYAVWTGIGALGTTLVGVLVFKDAMSLWTGLFLGLLLASIIGLKLTSVGT